MCPNNLAGGEVKKDWSSYFCRPFTSRIHGKWCIFLGDQEVISTKNHQKCHIFSVLWWVEALDYVTIICSQHTTTNFLLWKEVNRSMNDFGYCPITLHRVRAKLIGRSTNFSEGKVILGGGYTSRWTNSGLYLVFLVESFLCSSCVDQKKRLFCKEMCWMFFFENSLVLRMENSVFLSYIFFVYLYIQLHLLCLCLYVSVFWHGHPRNTTACCCILHRTHDFFLVGPGPFCSRFDF